MTDVTHAVTMNGRTSFELKGHAGSSPEEEMIELLGKLDGVQRYSMIVWALPADRPFDRVDLRSFPTKYIQCAGGAAGGFICEVREGTAEAGTQCALGRAEVSAGEEVVTWNGCSSTVPANEVLSVDEVGELFVEYFRSGSSPSSYARRELDLGARA
jgi:hypothetical protein